jgi:hypothetical protein
MLGRSPVTELALLKRRPPLILVLCELLLVQLASHIDLEYPLALPKRFHLR